MKTLVPLLVTLATCLPGLAQGEPAKTASVFITPAMLQAARANIARYPWAAALRDRMVAAAAPWLALSDDYLWSLMFGNTIKRSWMVWSDGYCPACKQGVPMYEWEMAALDRPWKVRCPHCHELFPKNDFAAFYRSGLDEQGVFQPARADRSLLFNAEHPDPADPWHDFGVDDGEGYVADGHRWRFIGAYLIYGQWKQAILGGIHNLAQAYALTGDPAYAHKAGVLLDRVADLYPTHDFGKEGVMYEGPPHAGYVSTWHDACAEVRQLALDYDLVFPALQRDSRLVEFLAAKARAHHLENPKTSWAHIQRNIEQRILADTLHHRAKIESNYPQTDLTLAIIRSVLGWPGNREEVLGALDGILEKATAVDGTTGEQGMAGYCAYALDGTAQLLETWGRLDPEFIPRALRKHPKLAQTYRFHVDTWCLGHYYPSCGDSGAFATRTDRYVGVSFSSDPGLGCSMYSLFWRLYQATGDPTLVQVLYQANGNQTSDLPHDIFCADPQGFQRQVQAVIAKYGPHLRVGSVNKQEWCLAILRSGEGAHARALFLDYDSGGPHGHGDGMNLGLYARGLDLLPDFGYPPVNYGGWGSERAVWYTRTPAHHTVTVDGNNTRPAKGKTLLWADGRMLRAVGASCPAMIEGARYERLAALVDISPADSYVLDLFRVQGGADHVKFVHGHFGTLTPHGLDLQPAQPYGQGAQMRNFRLDPAPAPGWWADFTIADKRGYLPPGTSVHLRYTDLTAGTQALTAESWVSLYGFSQNEEAWIPSLLVRRQGSSPLATTFVAVLEPYGERSNLRAIRRLPLQAGGTDLGETSAAVEVALADGRRDLLLAPDPARVRASSSGSGAVSRTGGLVRQPTWQVVTDADLAWIRRGTDGHITHLALANGSRLQVGDLDLRVRARVPFLEISLQGTPRLTAGDPAATILTLGRNVVRLSR